jgi:ATP-dependent DNA ligase
MECLPGEHIPEGDLWTYELKLDGYRIEAVKTGGKVTLYSRRGTDLSNRFEYVASALASLPDETVIDGELVALNEQGKTQLQSATELPLRRIAHHVLRLRCPGETPRGSAEADAL